MKFISIEIDGYKILKDNKINFNNKQIFPKWWQIIGLIWSNGSWKTTLCSIISFVFQSIFTRSKLDFNFKIAFEFNNSIRYINWSNSIIKLSINSKDYYEFNLGWRMNNEQKEKHNNKIYEFWDWKIILSTFETNGEYPNKKPSNYIWNDPLMKFDLASLYGWNSYWYPSITNGIIRFLKNLSKQNIANLFLEQMWFQLSWNVDLKIVKNIADDKPYLDNEDNYYLYDDNSKKSRHYTIKKELNAIKKLAEVKLYKKILRDDRLKLSSESQSINFYDALCISKDYFEFMWKYIFLNWLKLIKNNKELSFSDLSSGEKFLIMRYISILSGIENNSIIIVEEPENHLNPRWRELIIPALHKVATEYNSILIFTTHDYRVIRYLHNNCVLNISKGSITKMKKPTLLCDEFDFESIWEKIIPFVYQDLKNTYYNMQKEEKIKLLNSMCNVQEKIILKKDFLNNYEKY